MIGIPVVVLVARGLCGSERELCVTLKYLHANSSFFLTRLCRQLLIPQLPVVFKQGASLVLRTEWKENEMKKCFDVWKESAVLSRGSLLPSRVNVPPVLPGYTLYIMQQLSLLLNSLGNFYVSAHILLSAIVKWLAHFAVHCGCLVLKLVLRRYRQMLT